MSDSNDFLKTTYMALRWGDRNMVSQAGKKNVEATFFNNDRSYNKRLILVAIRC